MKTGRILASCLALFALSMLIFTAGTQKTGAEEPAPQNPHSLDAVLENKISYQGVLKENGLPVTGSRDMVFRLYDNDTCTTTSSPEINLPGVQVDNGFFNVMLPMGTYDITGSRRWLALTIDSVQISCQEILAAPYALSLRPGAKIIASGVDGLLSIDNDTTGPVFSDSLNVTNDSDYGDAIQITAQYTGLDSTVTDGYGVYSTSVFSPGVYGSSNNSNGIVGESLSANGAGVMAKGRNAGPDLLLSGNASTTEGDDGCIHSDPIYPSSDIVLVSNDAFSFYLDKDGNLEDADLALYETGGNNIFNIDESGDVTYDGALVGAFPRPAYNSGWVSISKGGYITRSHTLGGAIDDYVVELTCKDSALGINNLSIGFEHGLSNNYGAWYENLSGSSVTIHRNTDDLFCGQIRIRIWVIK